MSSYWTAMMMLFAGYTAGLVVSPGKSGERKGLRLHVGGGVVVQGSVPCALLFTALGTCTSAAHVHDYLGTHALISDSLLPCRHGHACETSCDNRAVFGSCRVALCAGPTSEYQDTKAACFCLIKRL